MGSIDVETESAKIVEVGDILRENSLGNPTLNALIKNAKNYEVLLLQPQGDIEADIHGVRNRNQKLALDQYRKFLEDAEENNADLVITPEYSMPWSVLEEAIMENRGPAQGKLWVLGCESIKLNELDELKDKIDSFATVIYETLDSTSSRFVSPLAYVFKAPTASNNEELRTVIVVQFKTHPMADSKHFETNGMQRGNYIYQFGGDRQNSKLVSLICADVFRFDEHMARDIYDRALIIHIQLNPKPRNEYFTECREKLLKYDGDETEILCLNWAENVIMQVNGEETHWENIAGSAWYLKSEDFDCDDRTLCNNHRLGLYYTWLQPRRSHALFFNYIPATYLLTATKVSHHAVPGPVSNRRGPQLTKTCIWDNDKWVEKEKLDDGFSTIVSASGNAKEDIKRIADGNPFKVERILALCVGEIIEENWYEVKHLDSCTINSQEIIQRITFAQDTHRQAEKFRKMRLRRCGHLCKIIEDEKKDLTPGIEDLKKGFEFRWSRSNPHQNVIVNGGENATIIYMGEEHDVDDVKNTVTSIETFIHKSCQDEYQSRSAKQRVHVWFHDDNNTIIAYNPRRHLQMDHTGDEIPYYIGREE